MIDERGGKAQGASDEKRGRKLELVPHCGEGAPRSTVLLGPPAIPGEPYLCLCCMRPTGPGRCACGGEDRIAHLDHRPVLLSMEALDAAEALFHDAMDRIVDAGDSPWTEELTSRMHRVYRAMGDNLRARARRKRHGRGYRELEGSEEEQIRYVTAVLTGERA